MNVRDLIRTLSSGARIFSKSGVQVEKIIGGDIRLLNGGSKLMSVNGSVTPQVFKAAPPADQIWFVEWVSMTMADDGDMDLDVFGSLLAPLTNGVELGVKIDGVDYINTKFKDNADILDCFFGGSAVSTANPAADPGFGNTPDMVSGRCELTGYYTKLDGSKGDEIKMIVNDDLTGIDLMTSALRFHRIIE